MAEPMMDPAADAAPQEAAAPSYEICIRVQGPQVSVGVESGADEEGATAPAYKPAKSIQDALMMAVDIYKNNGQMPEASSGDAFREGYGKSEAPSQGPSNLITELPE